MIVALLLLTAMATAAIPDPDTITLEVDQDTILADGVDVADVMLTLRDEDGAALGDAQVDAIDVAAGADHTCALLADGTVHCWGDNSAGQLGAGFGGPETRAATGITHATALVAGWFHTCALVDDGTIQCWGSNVSGQLGNATSTGGEESTPVDVDGITDAIAISAGGAHTCAVLDDGAIKCWGSNWSGQLSNATSTDTLEPTPVSVDGIADAISVTASAGHTCALLVDGTIKCWGDNSISQLGNASTSDEQTPTPVSVDDITSATSMTAGLHHTCALLDEGSIRCWGSNWQGQLGNETIPEEETPTPVHVDGITDAIAIAAGERYTCALLEDRTIKCWGNNWYGQLGNGNTMYNQTVPVVVSDITDATSIAAGSRHTCALLADGTIRCWGDNRYFQLGFSETRHSAVPVEVLGPMAATDVTAGSDFTCAIVESEGVRCWGENWYGQLGAGTFAFGRPEPAAVQISPGATFAAAGEDHACALPGDGTVQCWGSNWDHESGTTTAAELAWLTTPVGVDGITNAAFVTAGGHHTCALLGGGTIKCWGSNLNGQLGNVSIVEEATPTPIDVEGITDAVAIRAGGVHTCALLGGGAIKCWGLHLHGQLGNETTTDVTVPTPVGVDSITGATAITAGGAHTCALLGDGSVKCWGLHSHGQLGNETMTELTTSTPVSVEGITDATALVGGAVHTCALLEGGTIKCWGYNSYGQLGDGAPSSPRARPAPVQGISSATAIAAGDYHTCALLDDGAINCWGSNLYGQLGDGIITGIQRTPGPAIEFSAVVKIEASYPGIVSSPDHTGDGTFTATLTCIQTGTATITATINGATVTDQASIECEAPPNTPPEALDMTWNAVQNTVTNFILQAQDAEQEAGELDYSVTSPTLQDGTTIVAGRMVQYTPPPGVCGVTDIIGFTVTDAGGLQDTAQVRVFIACPGQNRASGQAQSSHTPSPVLDPPNGPTTVTAIPGQPTSIWIRPPANAPAGSTLMYELPDHTTFQDLEWSQSQGHLSFQAPMPEPGQTLVHHITFRLTLDGRSSEPLVVELVTHREDAPPVLDVTVTPPGAAAGDVVVLDASGSHDPEGAPLSFQWVQTGGPLVELGNTTAPVVSFVAPDLEEGGQETLVFSVVASDGGKRARLEDIRVHLAGPPASESSVDVEPVLDADLPTPPVSFDALPQGDGTILFRVDGEGAADYTWDFGDGTTRKGGTVIHQYAESGQYQVQLTRDGQVDASRDVAVHVPAVQSQGPVLPAWLVAAAGIVLVAPLVMLWLLRRRQA